jgi:CubicO group peptidase (beta-lactamase class C family)
VTLAVHCQNWNTIEARIAPIVIKLSDAKGYGFADVEHGVPVKPETAFQSGSVGKQFTATLVMMLVEEGKVRVDESVRTYLPGAPSSRQPIT